MVEVSDKDLEQLKYEYHRATLLKDSLEKNYERRKKLNLLDDAYEREIKADISKVDDQMRDMQRRIRSAESEKARSQIISEGRHGSSIQFK